MTLAQASSTASSRFVISISSSCAWRPTAVTNSRISARFSVDDGTCSVNFLSMEGILNDLLIETTPRSAPFHSARLETLKSGLLIVEHFKNILKAQNLESVSDLWREAAYLDVAATVAHLFYETHKHAQTCGRNVVEFFAVDQDANTSGIHSLLNRVLELRRRVGVHEPFERDD